VKTRINAPKSAPAQRSRARDLLPFGWDRARGDDLAERETLFRFPTADDPAPGTARLLAMSIYAALLGAGGVGVGLRGLVAVIGGVSFWYVPVLAVVGLLGVALTIGAFLSIHRRFLPWGLLLAATIPLAADVLIVAS
jgi:hypothetical protein